MVIREEKRLLVTWCRKCRPPPFSVFISLQIQGISTETWAAPAFGPAMIEEGGEATAYICNHKHIVGELRIHFLETAAPFFRWRGFVYDHVDFISEGRVKINEIISSKVSVPSFFCMKV